jgi:hypothetical protein
MDNDKLFTPEMEIDSQEITHLPKGVLYKRIMHLNNHLKSNRADSLLLSLYWKPI